MSDLLSVVGVGDSAKDTAAAPPWRRLFAALLLRAQAVPTVWAGLATLLSGGTWALSVVDADRVSALRQGLAAAAYIKSERGSYQAARHAQLVAEAEARVAAATVVRDEGTHARGNALLRWHSVSLVKLCCSACAP